MPSNALTRGCGSIAEVLAVEKLCDCGKLIVRFLILLHTCMCNGNQQQFILLNIQQRKLHILD